MKFSVVLSLAAVSSAFVVPSEQVLADLAPAREEHHETWYDEVVDDIRDGKDSILASVKHNFAKVSEASKHAWDEIAEQSTNAIDDAMKSVNEASDAFASAFEETASDAQSWFDAEAELIENEYDEYSHQLEDAVESFDVFSNDDEDADNHPPHHPPHHRPPHHRRPHHPPHHREPNETVYELINNSKYTTKLAFYINQYPDLIKALNSTKANYTIFAPTDSAFEKIPEHAPKPSKEELLALLSYHVVPGLYPASRVLVTHTVPTLFKSKHLGAEEEPQRLRLGFTFRGLTVNLYSRIVAVNIVGTNGIIHGVDAVIIPPPRAIKLIELLPSGFSTLQLGLEKTDLFDLLNSTKHAGGTLFAPTNRAFAKLGPRINAFLFSEHGRKYLKALLEYHVVPKNTLYSDAFYSADQKDTSLPRGRFHVDLPTLLKDRSLSVDVARWGGWITIKVNAFTSVSVQDIIAADGVIQTLDSVLIPPKRLGGAEEIDEEDMDVEEFKSRFDGLLSKIDL